MSDWDFGGAYANVQRKFVDIAGAEQEQEQARQLFPTKLAHDQATTRLNNANAALMEDSLQSKQNLAKISQGLELGQPGATQSTNIMKMAGAAMQAGDATLAQTLTLRASQVHTQEAREAEYTAQAKRQETEAKIKKADRYGKLLGAVRDEKDFQAANLMFAAEFGEEPPLKVYDPAQVDLARRSTIKMADALRAEHDAAMEEIARRRLGNTQSYRQQVLNLRQQDLNRKVERDKLAQKVDGKDIGSPTKSELTTADGFLDNEGKLKGLDPAARIAAASDLAGGARARRKRNPGMSMPEAMQQEYAELVKDGYFGSKQSTTMFGFGTKTTPIYGKPGGSPERAIAVPSNRALMKPNLFYNTPKGPLLYLGNGKWKAQAAASSGGSGSDDDDEDE